MYCRKGYYSVANDNSSEGGSSQWARVEEALDKAEESEEEKMKISASGQENDESRGN